MQEAGLTTTIELIQEPLVAVIVTSVLLAILITLFPETVPEVVVIVAFVFSVKLNSHVLPVQILLPAVNFGNTHAVGQSKFGVLTVVVEVQPAPLEAIIVTEEFLSTLVIEFPETIPLLDETPPVAFVKKFMVYEVPLQEISPAVNDGLIQVGHCFAGITTDVDVPQPVKVAVIVGLEVLGTFTILSPLTVPAVVETDTEALAFVK